jgi:CRISPR/Cas system-associated protein Cas10 (large subunit of type III CRISPR-Cas system)
VCGHPEEQVLKEVYIHFDGDDIGPGLELLLLDGLLEQASYYSRKISEGMDDLERHVISIPGTRVIVMGGDDLVATSPFEEIDLEIVFELQKRFESLTSRTISVGIGESPKAALQNLHRAKLLGRNRVVSTVDGLK